MLLAALSFSAAATASNIRGSRLMFEDAFFHQIPPMQQQYDATSTNDAPLSGGTWLFYLMLNAFFFLFDAAGYGCNSCNDDPATTTYNNNYYEVNNGGGRTLWGSDSWGDDGYNHHSSSSSSSSSSHHSSSSGARLHTHPNSSHILHPNHRAHPKSTIVLLDLLVVVAAAAFMMKKVSSPYTLTHFDYTYYITLLSLYSTSSSIAIPL